MPEKSYIEKTYDKEQQKNVWSSIAEDWSHHRSEPMPEIMEYVEKVEGKTLDLGCGAGRFFSPKVTHACDFSDEMVRLARKNVRDRGFGIKVDKSESSKLMYPDAFFDCVLCIASLHCMDEVEQQLTLAEVFRVLKPSGLFVLSVWNRDQKKFESRSRRLYVPYKTSERKIFQRYYCLFTEEEMHTLLEKAGFTVIEIKSFRSPSDRFENRLFVCSKPQSSL